MENTTPTECELFPGFPAEDFTSLDLRFSGFRLCYWQLPVSVSIFNAPQSIRDGLSHGPPPKYPICRNAAEKPGLLRRSICVQKHGELIGGFCGQGQDAAGGPCYPDWFSATAWLWAERVIGVLPLGGVPLLPPIGCSQQATEAESL